MRPTARAFYTQVTLPCTIFCGPDAAQKLSGTALKIERETLILRIGGGSRALPRMGETVDLEVHFPLSAEGMPAKDLCIRGQVVEVTDTGEGSHRFVLNFRRAHFKDRNGARPPKKRKAPSRRLGDVNEAEGWEM
jgi:hypothetical protein